MTGTRLERLKHLREENPGDIFTLFALAKEFEKAGATEDASRCYQELLISDPDYLGAYFHFGKLLELLGVDNQALDIYRQGIERSKAANDIHSLAELQNAYQNLLLELDEV